MQRNAYIATIQTPDNGSKGRMTGMMMMRSRLRRVSMPCML